MRNIFYILVFVMVGKTGHAQTWTPLSVGNTADVMDLSFPSADTGFASLGNGTMRKTFDGGLTWSNVNLHEPGSGGSQIEFLSSAKGFVIDDSGIVATTNGGASWYFSLLNLNVLWVDIFFYDPNIGYASGTTPAFDSFLVYKTVDAGVTWLPCTSIQDFNAVWPVIFFRTPLEGYIAGSDQVHRTNDGGITWTSVYTAPGPDLIGTITAPDASNAFCATQYFVDIAKSTNGGNTWVSTGQALASPAYDSHFLNGTHGFICGGTGITAGYIIETFDGGGSWSPAYSGGQTMLRMDFPSATTGYCGGTGGLILKYSDPTSVTSPVIHSLKIYPNPTADFLTIENIAPNSTITITNSLGQIILQQPAIDNRMQIDVNQLAEGVYALQVCDDQYVMTSSFIRN